MLEVAMLLTCNLKNRVQFLVEHKSENVAEKH